MRQFLPISIKKTTAFLCLSFFLISFASSAVLAQNFITGTVINAENNAPLSQVEITDTEFNLLAFSNKKGAFTFRITKTANFEIVFFKEGFAYQRLFIDLANLQENINVKLTPLGGNLEEVTIKTDKDNDFGISRMKTVEGFGIYAGKKTELINMRDIPANLATNNSRQVFAKVPGFNIWESDCAGLQLGVGGRGLSPNRSTNFNMRQNGYDISADPMGYPESYYAPPMQAIERIEVVRGAASLQYGSQFGGLVNFKLKKGDETKKIAVESSQTIGSYWYANSFNAIGGQVGKLNYYTYYQYRRGNCWRCNSSFGMHAAFARLEYAFSEKISLSAEHTFLTYLAQQAGGLTDVFFEQDPQQSIRESNWFQIKWNLSAINFDWKFSSKTKLNSRFSMLNAARNAVGNLGRIDRTEDITENRNLLIDNFAYGVSETRVLHRYNLLGLFSNLIVGARFYMGSLDQAQGLALPGESADFNFVNDEPYYLSYQYPSKNAAFFAENVFQISPKYNITPGLRIEWLNSQSQGSYFNYLTDLAGNIYLTQRFEEDKTNSRAISLFGITSSYKPNENIEIYGGISQNYRPIGFNDLRVANANLIIDSLISDEKGYNLDFGVRGNLWDGALNFDVTAFYLKYGNKIGNVLITVPDTIIYQPVPIVIERSARFRTNVSEAHIIGLEGFAEFDFIKKINPSNTKQGLSLFVNLALISGKYKSDNTAFDGKKVEDIPPVNFKSGLTYRFKNTVKLGGQITLVTQHFSDATNASFSPSAVEGIIPSYHVLDFFAAYNWKAFTFEVSINNLTDQKYFTRRATGYPGPGIIPAEGFSAFFTTSFNF